MAVYIRMNVSKRIVFTVLLFCAITLHGAQPDDAELSRLLVGEWQGARTAMQYMKDGTWRWDPLQGTTHGKWSIEKGHLIETWRFIEKTTDSSDSYTIVFFNHEKLVLRSDEDGTVATLRRMAHPLKEDENGRIIK